MDNFVADAIFIDAEPERVFAALLDPNALVSWLDARSVTMDAREGGVFRAERSDGARVEGKIIDLHPPERLEVAEYFHEAGGARRGPMRLRLSLRPHDGGAWLTVRQDGLDGAGGWQAFAQQMRREWVAATVALKRLVEGI